MSFSRPFGFPRDEDATFQEQRAIGVDRRGMAARRIVWELVDGGECSAETRTISQRYPKLGASYWKDEAAGWEAIDTRKAKAFKRFGSIVHPMSFSASSGNDISLKYGSQALPCSASLIGLEVRGGSGRRVRNQSLGFGLCGIDSLPILDDLSSCGVESLFMLFMVSSRRGLGKRRTYSASRLRVRSIVTC